ncbi:cation diffusion facilitator family transporter [Erythrobacter arachoides]|uniref:Cation diffusion facilitator family transporter n=1 Tax=Aurantiacibacter arachoides TaxID=1850444 RepID=A0A844ZY34_9SPHN|nr:cation diffusion facilitator family transporter [Aurantiacibacter arachoides]MXO92374.1 cation diffusion facilitator family transporter [Aurantiacibacter arachoides]GGD57675.1 cobalt transporter [Aurantiacibacter arachoides]
MGHSHAHGRHDHGAHAPGGHGPGHGHAHAPADFGRAFAVGIVLNTAFVVVEAVFGLLSGSMALVADAGHNLSDVLGLLIAWGASIAARRPPSSRFTYGLKSSTILAAFANAVLLLVAIGAILIETVRRFVYPVEPQGEVMIWVAGVGILINTATALMFMRGRKHDLNIRGAFLHMAADALVSVGVVIAGIAILLTGEVLIDPFVSLTIVAVIAWGTWGLLKDSVKMSLLAVPDSVDEGEVRGFLAALPGVAAVHDLHIWPMSTTETALTAHLVMPGGHPGDAFLRDAAEELAHHHAIGHITIQVETGGEGCEGRTCA